MKKEFSFKFVIGVISKIMWIVAISLTTLLMSAKLLGFELAWKIVLMPLFIMIGVTSVFTLILVVGLLFYIPYQYFKIKKEIKKIVENHKE